MSDDEHGPTEREPSERGREPSEGGAAGPGREPFEAGAAGSGREPVDGEPSGAGRSDLSDAPSSSAATTDNLHPGPEALAPRRGGGGTRRTRAASRRAIRRRRLVALAVLVAVVVVIVLLVLRSCGGDPFVGTWAKGGSGTVVISRRDHSRYLVALGTRAERPAKRSDDRLTVTRNQNGRRVTIWFTPGAQADTLEEHFPDGTTSVLMRR